MQVTRDVILDLFPVYLSGEASADTKTLVDSYLKRHPELAAQLRDQWSEAVSGLPVPPEVEVQSLRRTRNLIAWRSRLMAFAVFFTLLPFSFGGGKGGFAFLILHDSPKVAALLSAAALCWLAFYLLGRRLKVTG